MPDSNKNIKYAIIAMPRTGLRFDGGSFLDGHSNRVQFNGELNIYETHARAETAKNHMKAKWPDWEGDFVMVRVGVHKIGEEEATGE